MARSRPRTRRRMSSPRRRPGTDRGRSAARAWGSAIRSRAPAVLLGSTARSAGRPRSSSPALTTVRPLRAPHVWGRQTANRGCSASPPGASGCAAPEATMRPVGRAPARRLRRAGSPSRRPPAACRSAPALRPASATGLPSRDAAPTSSACRPPLSVTVVARWRAKACSDSRAWRGTRAFADCSVRRRRVHHHLGGVR